MTPIIIFQILFIILNHWIADFIMQTHEMATQKSKSNYWLTKHVVSYGIGMTASAALVWYFSGAFIAGFIWLFINTILHWITDYNTSRWTSKLYAQQKYHDFFVVIGMDQVIHYTCLFITYSYFTTH